MPGSAFERSIVPKAEVQQTEDDLFRKKIDHQGRLETMFLNLINVMSQLAYKIELAKRKKK